MVNTAELKRRIKAIGDTSQIMHAMELISVAKKRSVAVKYYNNLHYFIRLRTTIKDIVARTSSAKSHDYLIRRQGRRTAFIVIASDRGLAGEYNKRVCNAALEQIQNADEAYLFTIGRMARDFFTRAGITPDVDFINVGQEPSLAEARIITEDIMYLYDNNLLDKVRVVYTKVEGSKMRPVSLKLLPLEVADFGDVQEADPHNEIMEFMPSGKEVLDTLVPQYIIGALYSCLVQAQYCEHHERMLNMSQAYDNATTIMDRLRLDYNRARQSAITEEISETAAGAILGQ